MSGAPGLTVGGSFIRVCSGKKHFILYRQERLSAGSRCMVLYDDSPLTKAKAVPS